MSTPGCSAAPRAGRDPPRADRGSPASASTHREDLVARGVEGSSAMHPKPRLFSPYSSLPLAVELSDLQVFIVDYDPNCALPCLAAHPMDELPQLGEALFRQTVRGDPA